MVRTARTFGIVRMSTGRPVLAPTSRIRFASSTGSSMNTKPSRAPPLEYKGRITKPEPIAKPTAPITDDAIREAGFEPAKVPPPKREKTYDQRYRSTTFKVLAIMCTLPIALVTTPYVYRRVFLGEQRKRLTVITEASE